MRIIILSGGSGFRLWPLSNSLQSKQFLRVLKGPDGETESMLQRVYRQLEAAGVPGEHISIVAGSQQKDNILSQIGPETRIIGEPERRNTFPAIALSALHLAEIQHVPADEAVIVMPADVYTEEGYFDLFPAMEKICASGQAELVLMGIRPERPSNQFGYIVPENTHESSDGPEPEESGQGFVRVARFVEKPPVEEAEELIRRGALWNGGVFAFRLGWMTDRVNRYLPGADYEKLRDNYALLEKTSFDYAVVEKASDIAAVAYSGPWMDLGTWESLSTQMDRTGGGNIVSTEGSGSSVVINKLPIPMAVLNVTDAVVVATWDGILVSDKKESAHVKDYLNESGLEPRYGEHLWGRYYTLESMDTGDGRCSRTRHLAVEDGRCLCEAGEPAEKVWTVVSGSGEASLDGEVFPVNAGDSIRISSGKAHSIRGIRGLHLVEVRIGSTE